MATRMWFERLAFCALGVAGTLAVVRTHEMTLDEALQMRSDILTPSQRALVAAVLRRNGLRVVTGLETLAPNTPYAVDSLSILTSEFTRASLHMRPEPGKPR